MQSTFNKVTHPETVEPERVELSVSCAGIQTADDTTAFSFYRISKMRRNLIKMRSCAIFFLKKEA